MMCNACARKKAKSRGSHVPHFCDACGWAIRETGDVYRPALAQAIVGQAMVIEKHNRSKCGENVLKPIIQEIVDSEQ